ncbi:vankyrin-d8.1 [Ichnoviriform fugitivi]|uniref:Vankyrin-d8.1 n=1 Tax=Ichnoviriform fugitivi TaxID=265522 RepID=A2Q0L7_9VIRU|nr:vankyrin-d8.1 [Ichnoviriform fugitivi]BAF45732.1 vankyrin-d8.1 [Ichnoviriform fugitivi]
MTVSEVSQLSRKNPITGNTIFHEAAKHGSLELLYRIRDNMDQPYYSILAEKNNDGETCIHIAVRKHMRLGAINLVKVLVELGADLNAKHGLSGCTVLLFSVWRGDYELAEWLCQQPGIDMYATSWNSMTVFHCAYINGDQRMLDILLAAVDAADGNVDDSDSETSAKNE